MTAKELLSNEIIPARTSDKGEDILSVMHLFHVRHIPIVNNLELLGLLSESDIVTHDPSEPVGSYSLSLFRPYCFENEHVFDIMGQLSRFDLTLIPVIDISHKYLGVITMEALIHYFADSFAFSENGSVLTIESNEMNYSMSEICRTVESEGVSILSTFINKVPDSTRVQITVKTNATDNFRIKQNLERFGYDVLVTVGQDEYADSLKERFDSLMAYLNV